MNLLRAPVARFIGCYVCVRFVLYGDGIKIDAINIFHAGDVAGKLARVSPVVGKRSNKASAVDVAIALEGGLWAPRTAPNSCTARLGHLHDAAFIRRSARRDPAAQERKPDAIEGDIRAPIKGSDRAAISGEEHIG